MTKGFVYLVGAGPGRADLITVRGAEVLKKADCIIYDKLANPALLRFAPKDAEIIPVPKRVGPGSFTQQEINEVLIEKAAEGKSVVRLKGGDPCIFGRCTEEAVLCAEAGIDFEIVPGVTAGIAAGDYTGIILTDREYSSQVVFVTGHEAEGKQKSSIDWDLLARFRGTIVFYMAVGNLGFIAKQLMDNGMAGATPAAVVADATFPTQRVVKAPLAAISDTCKRQEIEPPAVVVIGAAADSDMRLNWFMKKPLFGKTIVVTRDVQGNARFAAKIIQQGGSPIEFPTIEIRPLTRANEFLRALAKFSEYDWVIFTSANGVLIFFDCLCELGKDGRVFGSAKVAAIGSETAAKLAEFGIKADFVPDVFTGEELGKQLLKAENLRAKAVLLLRSRLASEELPELLRQGGAKVDDVPVYDIVTVTGRSARLVEKIAQGKIDWLTFASPSSAKAFFEHIPPDSVSSSSVKVASIGPVTSEQLRKLDVSVDVESSEHTIDGLLEAIERAYG